MGVLLLWFSFAWGFGIILQVGASNNPRQRKIVVGPKMTKLLTWGAVTAGELAIVPILFQLNAVLFLIWGVVEYVVRDFERPRGAFTAWSIGVVVCSLLTPLMNRRE